MFVSTANAACKHTSLSSWRSDNDSHWKLCNDCDEKVNKSSHSMKWQSISNEKHNQKCSVCARTTSSSKHSFSSATCTSAKKCKTCGQTNGKALGHNWKEVITKVATCSEKGKKYSYCTRCLDKTKETDVAKSDHVASSKWTYESSYHYKLCTMCKQKISSTMESHNVKNGVCKTCSYSDKTACKHPNQKEVNLKVATCAQNGEKRYICSDCGYESEIVKTDKSPHGKIGGIVVKSTKALSIKGNTYNYGVHYKQCLVCKQKLLIHALDSSGKCTDSSCDFGKGGCNHKFDKYILENSKHYQICIYCNEREEVGHIYSAKAGYSSDKNGHYTHCVVCDAVNPEYLPHYMVDVKCNVCGWICENHEYVLSDKKGILKCNICGSTTINPDDCEHNIVMTSDSYGHYSACTECGFKDMYTKGKEDVTKYGAHTYGENVDLCNGKHSKKCKYCDYEFVSVHTYADDLDNLYPTCTGCGSQNVNANQSVFDKVIEFDIESKDDVKLLQEKLLALGYDEVGEPDGIMGKNTRKAMSNFLNDQGSSRIIEENSDINSEVYTLLYNCDETKEQAEVRKNKALFDKLVKKLDLGIVTENERVLICQLKLKELGYFVGSVSGTASEDTELAIKKFFEINGFDMSKYNVSKFSTDMLEEIINCDTTYVQAIENFSTLVLNGTIKFDLANNSTQCEMLQSTLSALGYFTGTVNGEFDKSTINAFNHLCQDLGLVGSDGNTLWISKKEQLNDISFEIFKAAVTTTENGLEKIEIEAGSSLMDVVVALDNYTGTHGFKYKQVDIPASPDDLETRYDFDGESGLYKPGKYYAIDCAEAVTSVLYLYAEANGNKKMADYFNKKEDGYGMGSYAGAYIGVGKKLKNGGSDEYFELIELKNAQPGDIIVYAGNSEHVEFCAQEGIESEKPQVYNWGNSKDIMHYGTTETSKRNPSTIKYVLRLKDNM